MYWTRIEPGRYRADNNDVDFLIIKTGSLWQVWHGTWTQPHQMITSHVEDKALSLWQAQELAESIYDKIKAQRANSDNIFFTMTEHKQLYGMTYDWHIIPLDRQQEYTSDWVWTNSPKTHMEGYGQLYKHDPVFITLKVLRHNKEILRANIGGESNITYSVTETKYTDEEWQWLPGHMSNLSNAAWLTMQAIERWRNNSE